jgi:hypothetical protein
LYDNKEYKGDDLQTLGGMAGIDLINQPAEARNWVMDVLSKNMKAGQSVTVGNYCYLDGDKHVKLSVAMDVISETVSRVYVPPQLIFQRPSSHDVSVAQVQGARHYRLLMHPHRRARHQQRSLRCPKEKRSQLALVLTPCCRKHCLFCVFKCMCCAGTRNCSASSLARNSSQTRRHR